MELTAGITCGINRGDLYVPCSTASDASVQLLTFLLKVVAFHRAARPTLDCQNDDDMPLASSEFVGANRELAFSVCQSSTQRTSLLQPNAG